MAEIEMKKAGIQDFICFDVETGGIPKKDEQAVLDIALTEIALVYVNANLEIVDTYSSLIKPYFEEARYDAAAAEVSGIVKQDCIDEGKPIALVVAEIMEWIEFNNKSGKKPVFVGHNLRKFDSYFIENMFAFCDKEVYDYASTILIDTLEECWKIFPEAPNHKLGTMCQQFDVELVEAHRALPDTMANTHLWIKILKRMRGEGEVSGDTVIEHSRMRTSGEFKF